MLYALVFVLIQIGKCQICLNLFKEVDHGEGVVVSKFGGEGTGFKSMKDVEWKNNEDVTLIVKGETSRETNYGKGKIIFLF